ncbi:YciI family protein [Actinomadura sp. K4S16]|uniref:YciI family protein n=1 Tax=Actinomadura sp. K4S16 TaxID=1316147 RepID=UPI0011EC6F0E|nr:YciI family protein [Actinomadura sp. K4S16]
MRFVIMSRTNEYFEAGNPPSPELFERMERFMREAAASGVLLQADGLLPSSAGARLSARDGVLSVTDGPFTEAKELVGGLAFIEARDLAEAKEWGRRFALVHEGACEVEIRQVAGPGGPGDRS